MQYFFKKTKYIILTIVTCTFFVLGIFVLIQPEYNGIDISHHQGYINWNNVAKDKEVKFVYIKATEGTNYTDKLYKKNRDGARKNGILVGAYHFFRANADGKAQFEHFKKIVGKKTELIPVLDLECDGGEVNNRAVYRKNVEAFITACKNYYGVKPIIYVNVPFLLWNVTPSASGCKMWYAYVGVSWIGRVHNILDSSSKIIQISDGGDIKGINNGVDINYCSDIEEIKLNR